AARLAERAAGVNVVELRPEQGADGVARSKAPVAREGEIRQENQSLWLRQNGANVTPAGVSQVHPAQRAQLDHESSRAARSGHGPVRAGSSTAYTIGIWPR